MEYRKNNIHCSCADALYLVPANQWDKCNL